MRQYLVAGLAAALITGGLIDSAPRPAPAACTADGSALPAGAMDPSSPTAPGNVAWYLKTRLLATITFPATSAAM
jgi:hypothetical protein